MLLPSGVVFGMPGVLTTNSPVSSVTTIKGACPNYSGVVTAAIPSPDVSVGMTPAGNVVTYSVTTVNKSPSDGVPGVISLCVYPNAGDTSGMAGVVSLFDSWLAGISCSSNCAGAVRPNGNPTNIPMDGSTQDVLQVTYSTLPTTSLVVLHINDQAECTALFGVNENTCFVLPEAQISLVTQEIVGGQTHVNDTVTVTDLTPGNGTPTGTVEFFLCGPFANIPAIACDVTGTPTDTETLSGTGQVATTMGFTLAPTVPGIYCWAAKYIPGSSAFAPAVSQTTENECFNYQPTRTSDWWARHVDFLVSTWDAYMAANPGGVTVCGVHVTTSQEVMGAFWASRPELSNGNSRPNGAPIEMALAQNYLAAVLNVQAFGTNDGGLISSGLAACNTDNPTTIRNASLALAAWNLAGNKQSTSFDVGPRDAASGMAYADVPFWDSI